MRELRLDLKTDRFGVKCEKKRVKKETYIENKIKPKIQCSI